MHARGKMLALQPGNNAADDGRQLRVNERKNRTVNTTGNIPTTTTTTAN
jgi:hypothetical protein